MTETVDIFSPGRIGPLRLRNRIIKAATYEHMARRGEVTDALIDYHVAHAAGGAAMTTVAYCAVAPEGRTDGHQIVWRPEALPGLRRLTDAVHATGAAVSAQIGHSGPVNDPKKTGLPQLAPSRIFTKLTGTMTKAATPADIDRVVSQHAAAVRMAIEAGFDSVEIHLGHNYLASSFLSPKINRRTDEYGGSLENRARFPRAVMKAAHEAAGGQIAVLAKLNMDDGVPGGFWLDEAVQVAQWLDEDGSVDALQMTSGSSLLNPMYLFKGEVPLREFAAAMPQPLRAGVRLVGRAILREYPYKDLYLLEDARQVQAVVDVPMILLGGVTDAAAMDRAIANGFAFVAMGRALLREPDLPNRLQADRGVRSLCIHCNKCMATTFRATHCPLVLPEQRPGLRLGPEAMRVPGGQAADDPENAPTMSGAVTGEHR